MSKDITEDLLLKAGFILQEDGLYKKNDKVLINIEANTSSSARNWRCQVDNEFIQGDVDIKTVEHFNKLMELMNIDFRLKED